MRRQPPLGFGLSRIPSASSLHPKVRREVEKCVEKYDCSASFVIAFALEQFFNVNHVADYRKEQRPKKGSKVHNVRAA